MASDPSITLYAVGASISEGELVQKAGCCITLEYEDEYGRKSKRVITHPIGNGSLDRAHLQATHLALASITRPMRRIADIRLVCPGRIRAILDESDKEYSKSQVDTLCDGINNIDVVGEARKWITFYNHLRFVPTPAKDISGFAEARECAESQSGSDTGTVVE